MDYFPQFMRELFYTETKPKIISLPRPQDDRASARFAGGGRKTLPLYVTKLNLNSGWLETSCVNLDPHPLLYIMSSKRRLLVKKVDKAFSDYIKARDHYTCVVCGSKERVAAGHLLSRVAYSTRWDETQVFCQCSSCNFLHEQNPGPFTAWYLKKFGAEKYLELEQRYWRSRKWKDWELEELIETYKHKLEALKAQQSI